MTENLKYHCKRNRKKANGHEAVTVAIFDTEESAKDFVRNNPDYLVEEIWFMEYQNDAWVPQKTVWNSSMSLN